MQQEQRSQWPTFLGPDDDLYYVENLDTGEIEHLVFSSSEKKRTFVRGSGAWWPITADFYDEVDDPSYSMEFVDVEFIDEYDNMEREDAKNRVQMVPPSQPLVAAIDISKCPRATQDVAINLKNRRRAISVANYGPMNPNEENEAFWAQKADLWSVDADDAKKSICGNCAFFVVTSDMKSCIESGIKSGKAASDDSWGSVTAGDLGYCDAFDFKCAASRTCDAWVVGGPVTDNTAKSEG